MFLQNKYSKWYFNIIDKSKNRTYETGKYERHHIIPKSMGGSNKKQNICCLTMREHFVCHLLLTKFTENKNKSKMIFALWTMQRHNEYYNRTLTSRQYDIIRKMFIEEVRKKKHTKETLDLMSKNRKGLKQDWVIERNKKWHKNNLLVGVYEVIDPEGKIKIIENMEDFCIKNDLNKTTMSSLANGNWKPGSYKGYRVKKLGYVVKNKINEEF